MRSALFPALLLACSFATACGPAAGQPQGPEARAGDGAKAFEQVEDEVLRDLAAVDRRIAQRARLTPPPEDLRRVAMAAILGEDPTVAVIDGAIDPFSFDARARGLASAKQKITTLPSGPHASERDLLARLVEEEEVRLEEERALPRSASSLVRAIVETWRAPKSPREAADADRWLARRLASVREAMAGSNDPATALDVVRARELDDALDALERLVSAPGFTSAMQELVRVRDAVEAAGAKPAAKAHSEWTVIARRARAHLGITQSPDELARALADAEADLRAQAEKAVASAGLRPDDLATSLEKHVFVSGPCLDAVPGSRVRSMAAPLEREPACHLRHLVSRMEDARERALALAAMHDHVAIASWALDVARGASTIDEAEARHRLFVPVLPDTRARYERIALARPVAAIGTGEAVRILSAGDPKTRAAAWSTLGDVPFDVARSELGAAAMPQR